MAMVLLTALSPASNCLFLKAALNEVLVSPSRFSSSNLSHSFVHVDIIVGFTYLFLARGYCEISAT